MGQGEELFGAIALTGTECELVVYPREGHVPVEREHLRDALERTPGVVRPASEGGVRVHRAAGPPVNATCIGPATEIDSAAARDPARAASAGVAPVIAAAM